MVRLKIMGDTSIKGIPAYKGEIKGVDETEARILISYKLAEIYEEPPQTLIESEKQVEEALFASSKIKKRR